uniref:hypothetical protein n=1 Tax=Castellaniella defragrans TaxID=75697 RepID=UPI00333F184B
MLWLFVGIAKDSFYEESYSVLFIKKEPTLKIVFYNPTLTEANAPPIAEWGGGGLEPLLEELMDYCRYRFGIKDESIEALSACANRPHRSRNFFTEWYVGM